MPLRGTCCIRWLLSGHPYSLVFQLASNVTKRRSGTLCDICQTATLSVRIKTARPYTSACCIFRNAPFAVLIFIESSQCIPRNRWGARVGTGRTHRLLTVVSFPPNAGISILISRLDEADVVRKMAALRGCIVATVENSNISATIYEKVFWLILFTRMGWNDLIPLLCPWLCCRSRDLAGKDKVSLPWIAINRRCLPLPLGRFFLPQNTFGTLKLFFRCGFLLTTLPVK